MTQQLGSNKSQITLSLFQKGNKQVFEVIDNSGGFENLGTPLFITKQ